MASDFVGDVMLRVSAEDFLTPEYRHVYDAIRAQWSACQTVDVVTVLHRLGDAYRQMLVQIQKQRWIEVNHMEITEIPCVEERGFRIR